MTDEAIKIKLSNWVKMIGVFLLTVLSLVFSRNKPILKWIVAVIAMMVFGVFSYFMVFAFGLHFVGIALLIILFNVGVCLIIKAPTKWIIGSTIGLTTIATVWGVSILARSTPVSKPTNTQ